MTRSIRPVADADAPRLCELQTAGWRTEYPHMVDPEQWLADDGFDLTAREANMRRLIIAPETESFLAAVQDGLVVGFITVGESRDADRPGETELSWIYFDPAAHGTGFAADGMRRDTGTLFDEPELRFAR